MSPAIPPRYLTAFSHLRWRKQDGESIQVAFMETSHLFFVFRMFFDMLAERYRWTPMRAPGTGLRAKKAQGHKELRRACVQMGLFAQEMLLRGDLSPEHKDAMGRMARQILGSQRHSREQPQALAGYLLALELGPPREATYADVAEDLIV